MLTQIQSAINRQNGHANKQENGDHHVSFANLLDNYEPQLPRRGQYLSGEVLHIDHNVILADVDAKRTAVVPPNDLANLEEDILQQLAIGDEITLYVLRTPRGDEDLLVSLAKGLEQEDWQRAATLLDSEQALELKVTGYNKGGLLVDFGHLKGFVPASQVPDLQGYRDKKAIISRKAQLVGEELLLNVIEVNRQRSRLILSAKKAQQEQVQERLLELKLMEGDTVTGVVTNLVNFGAFVDLGDVEGLIHISELGWQRVSDPESSVSPGEEVEVKILHVEVDRQRVSLSRKALLPSPWHSFAESHSPGDILEGAVTNVTEFGAFVRVTEGVEGLIHASEMHGTQDFAPQDLLVPGDDVLVRIIDCQPDRQRLALSQRRVAQNVEIEWMQRRQDADAQQSANDAVDDGS